MERAKFNQCVAKYTKIKFNKSYKSGEINESMRQKGFNEKRIMWNFHFDKIEIYMDLYKKWIEDNVNILWNWFSGNSGISGIVKKVQPILKI